jgi:hypothetical protein
MLEVVDPTLAIRLDGGLSFDAADCPKTALDKSLDLNEKPKCSVGVWSGHDATSGDVEEADLMLVEPTIYHRDLLAPTPAFAMFESHELVTGPVKVKGDERHLLVELV